MSKDIASEGGMATGEAIDLMVDAIGGFPFMMQLVGYRSWDVSLGSCEITVKDVQRGVALAQGDLDQRVLEPTFYELSDGDLAFDMPHFKEFLLSKFAEA